MYLTTERLAAFIGGQMKIENLGENDLQQGEIAEAVVDGMMATFRMAWMARADGIPPKRWVKDDGLKIELNLLQVRVRDLGTGESGGNRLELFFYMIGEQVILFPPDGSRLDPRNVQGLDVPEDTTAASPSPDKV